mmetsp:Transcript_24260/g.21407  ORF Transcript_24260/g.21407 Transcript_24260/m.21407 type:complete len:108 (-) Transcript_24260:29-352(-)
MHIDLKIVDKFIPLPNNRVILVDTIGQLIILNSELEVERKIQIENEKLFDVCYCSKPDLLVCTTDDPKVILINQKDGTIMRKLHPNVGSCEKMIIYLEKLNKIVVPF